MIAHHIAPAVMRRAVDFALARDTSSGSPSNPDSGTNEIPVWLWGIFLADLVILFPIIVFANYTSQKVLPVFAIVEDENPPAYEHVLANEAFGGSVPVALSASGPMPINKTTSVAILSLPLAHDALPITSSFHDTLNLLESHGGYRSMFRAFGCFLFQCFVHSILVGLFLGAFNPAFSPVASLLASLLLVQYSTAWVHIVLTPPSPLRFWKRLPAFRSTFDATWRSVVLFWASSQLAAWSPYLFAVMLRFQIPDFSKHQPIEMPTKSDSWKAIVTALLSIVVQLLLVIPAYVTLIRVQASLLPDTQDAIIPFDRTFQGKVEPAVVGGKGYVSLTDAWNTFSRASWCRLVVLYAKIMLVTMAVSIMIVAVIVIQFLLAGLVEKPDHE